MVPDVLLNPGSARDGDRTGFWLAATAATGLGLAVALSRLAYEGGTNGLTVATLRAIALAIGLAVFCHISGRRLRIGRGEAAHCFGLGLLMSLAFYGNIGAVEYISVGLTALLFYTFPPMVALIQVLVVGERVSLPRGLAILCAFGGLAVMLGGSPAADAAPAGVALALGAAVSVAWSSVWINRRLSEVDPLVLTLHMAIVAAVVLVLLSAVAGSWQLPTRPVGWLGTIVVVMLQASSIPLYFLAVRRVGALRSAELSNLQPVVSIVAAMALYGELLAAQQALGGAMVIGAVIAMQIAARRSKAD